MDYLEEYEGENEGKEGREGEVNGDHDDNEAIAFTNSITLSRSSNTQIKQSSKPIWSKQITGKVVKVIQPGNREYVAVLSENNGSG